MINIYSIGFVLTAGTILAGVDYYDQTSKAGLSLGQMSPGAYIGTIPNRFGAAKDEKLAQNAERERKSRWRQGGQVYLPEPPEGWTRRALLEGDDSAILPADATLTGSMSNSSGKGFLEQMKARDHVAELKERAERSWIYQRGNETVFVEVNLTERDSNNSLMGAMANVLDATMMGNFEKEAGYGVFGGVGLTERLSMEGKRPYHFRFLEGTIGLGTSVTLRVHANASRETTEEILSRIDYDGLNNLLPQPMDSVGNDVAPPEGIDPVAFSLELRRLRTDFKKLHGLEAQYKISNLDTNALVVNAYAMRLAGEGGLDITGGKVTDLGGLIDLGYHRGRAAMMAGKSAQEVQDEISHMVQTVMQVADAETAAAVARAKNAPVPEMSPELKAELQALSGTAATAPSGLDPTLLARNPDDDIATIAAKNRARDMDNSVSGKVLMQVDEAASDRAAGLYYSRAIDMLEFAKFKDVRNATDEEMELGMAIAAAGFERKHELPQGSCSFDMGALRLECDTARGTQVGGVLSKLVGAVTGATDGAASALKPAEPRAMPKRLELSGGGASSGQRCVGSFCN